MIDIIHSPVHMHISLFIAIKNEANGRKTNKQAKTNIKSLPHL